MITLLLLGFALSLDSFRVSLGLGTLKLTRLRQLQIVIAFGVCDALAPLIGLLIGKSLLEFIGPWVEHIGPLLLCAYGVYVIYIAQRCAGSEAGETDRWMVLGLPLSLSLDNLIAGTTLGMIGFPILLSVTIIGVMSSLFSLAGLRLGKTAVNLLRFRADLIGGVVLIFIALTFVIEDLF
ncbi:MAG TPA: manganese efflux pump [Pyrinomonadaceae bacterium]|nr:manganese efflux pump [Pyrinomonadaceae bacterium]